MRGIGFKIATGVGATAPSCAALGLVGSSIKPDAGCLIGPLSPEGEGQSLCLADSSTGQPVDVEDWSKAKMQPTKPRSPDGQSYLRQVPPLLSAGYRPLSLSATTPRPTTTGSAMSAWPTTRRASAAGSRPAHAPGTRTTRCTDPTRTRSRPAPSPSPAAAIATAVASGSIASPASPHLAKGDAAAAAAHGEAALQRARCAVRSGSGQTAEHTPKPSPLSPAPAA